MSQLEGAIAATRFGIGAKPGEIAVASSDPRGWLKAQIRPDAAIVSGAGLKSIGESIRDQQDAYRGVSGPAGKPDKPGKPDGPDKDDLARMEIRKQAQKDAREGLVVEVQARGRHAATTADPFAERWARFWANHFTVAARNAQLIAVVGPFEREAIRPHVFGDFAGLLGHATFHPGMLMYLDANRSIGPSTEAARRRDAGLNENLAREILELHTLGVGSGYTQADIIEFAKALTGWTVGGPQIQRLAVAAAKGDGRKQRATKDMITELRDKAGETLFVPPLHEPGARTVLGKSYGAQPRTQAAAILDDLARHPATARHIAAKLARHFVADQPPASAIATLETAFTRSHGDLSVLARAVVDLDEAWVETPAKFKTPEELLVSVARASGAEAAFGRDQRTVYQTLGQQPFGAPSPAGWADDTATWSGADAIKKRLEWANAVSRRMTRVGTPVDFLDRALGPAASQRTRLAVSRAESAEQGYTLALMSPEFQRR